MAHVLRLIVALLLLCTGIAHALVPIQSGTQYRLGNRAWYTDKLASCTDYMTFLDPQDTLLNYSGPYITSGGACSWKRFQVSNGAQVGDNTPAAFQTQAVQFCPANSAQVSGGCQCATGYEEDSTHTQCVPQKSELEKFCQEHAAAKNTFKMAGSVAVAAGLPSSSCYVPDPPFGGADLGKGCSASIGNKVGVPAGDGTLDWSGVGSFDGTTCSAAPGAPTPPSKDDPCPGGFEGTVNGVTKCVPAEPDKGIEGVKQSSSTDANGTKQDVTQTTKCEGTKCTTTTTTTTTTSSGSVSTSTTSTTTSMEDKCKADPTNPICSKTQGGRGAGVSQSTCQENSSAQGCGGEGAGIGDLYAKKDKTIAQAFKKAGDDLKASPVGSAVGGFFNVGSGGSCPRVSGVVPFLNKTITIDAFCTDFAAQMFLVARAVLLMLATWMAFRIAIDH
ncbi:hypothetical protein ABL841_19255 [Variovorax paradoxus]|uniref:hypothetical protein n=1 Tax=Variovorax paradoxus TaxID=34073 RepID=UPI0012BB94AD|nr:hypothetical protein [Variovorax paradoxus]